VVELAALVIVWIVLNVCEKLYTPGERLDLIVWAVAAVLFIAPIWIAFNSGG